ncbi:hypothetical protein [Streptomyces sp. NPDC020996]|uniref:hypothetical protein n=1 Tax=Streptomyces sp. NPDC020996 TaxID=3154791 RepID=UPI0033F85AC4
MGDVAGTQELRAWAAKWLGDREVPEEFLQLTPSRRHGRAAVPHLATLLDYFLPSAEKEHDLVYGYWRYPGEVWPPPVVCIDAEAMFFTVRGRTLTEALPAHCAEDDSEAALLGQWFTDLGIPVEVRTDAEIPDPPVRMDPQVPEREL